MTDSRNRKRRKSSEFQRFQRPSESWNQKTSRSSSQNTSRNNYSNVPKQRARVSNTNERVNLDSSKGRRVSDNADRIYTSQSKKNTSLNSSEFGQKETNYYFPESEKKKSSTRNKNKSSSGGKKRPSSKKKKKSNWKYFRRLLGVVIVVGFLFLFNSFVITPTIIPNDSMEPIVSKGDWVLVDRLETPKQFQLIAFHNPENTNEILVERLIGLPGDTVTYNYDVLYVNSIGYMEPYLETYREAKVDDSENVTEDFSLSDLTGEKKVPKGNYFVLADNRSTNMDSRSFGFVSSENIIGTVNRRILPLKNFGKLE